MTYHMRLLVAGHLQINPNVLQFYKRNNISIIKKKFFKLDQTVILGHRAKNELEVEKLTFFLKHKEHYH